MIALSVALFGVAVVCAGDPVAACSWALNSSIDLEVPQFDRSFTFRDTHKKNDDHKLFQGVLPKYADIVKLRRVLESFISEAKNKKRKSNQVLQPSDASPPLKEISYFEAKLKDFEKSIYLLGKEKFVFKKDDFDYFDSKLKKFLLFPEKNY
jgi:hypothetical protein